MRLRRHLTAVSLSTFELFLKVLPEQAWSWCFGEPMLTAFSLWLSLVKRAIEQFPDHLRRYGCFWSYRLRLRSTEVVSFGKSKLAYFHLSLKWPQASHSKPPIPSHRLPLHLPCPLHCWFRYPLTIPGQPHPAQSAPNPIEHTSDERCYCCSQQLFARAL